jgi:hypothetical protein
MIMTVQSQISRADYRGNNVSTLFTVPFYFLDNSHLKVLRTDTATVPPTVAELVLNSDYVVTGAGVSSGGQVQTTIAPTATQVLTVLRNVPFTQLIHYVPNDPFPAATHEQALDQLTMEVQELNEGLTHSLQYPSYEPVPPTLPAASARANMFLAFGPTGQVQLQPITASVGAGDLRIEEWTDGTGYTSGTSTTVTLSRAYGTKANLGAVVMQGIVQDPISYTLSGTTLTFDGPIPLGIGKIWCTGGTTLSVYVPPDSSVDDAQLAWNSVLTRVVGSVAALQNLNPLKYQRASTNGYYPGGPGGGDYYYDSTYLAANANGFTAIASLIGNGCWRLMPRDMVNLFQAGAKGDDIADDTAATQAAVTSCEANGVMLRVPAAPAAFRLTATINHGADFVAKGDGVAVVKTKNFTTNNTHGPGAWFHIDHAGVGFKSVAVGAVNQFSVEWNDIGTVRNQPTPNGAAAFTPNANDYDFYADTTDNTFRNVVVLNPTKAFYSTGGGRQLYYNIKGQPLLEGIHTDTAYDTCRYDHIHFWPWWSEAAGVQNYTKANATAFYSARNDNPMYSNLFAFGYFTGFAFANNANGPTSLAALSNINLDSVAIGVRLDSTCSAATLFFSNLTIQGLFDATQSNSGVWALPGSNANQIRIDNGAISGFGANDIRMDGTGNYCWAKNIRYGTWGLNNPGLFTAVAVAATCRFESDFPFNAYTSQAVFSGAGAFQVQLAKGSLTLPTDSAGHALITHGASVLPNGAVVTVMNDAGAFSAQPVPGSFTTSQITVRVRDSTGAPLVNSSITLAYDSFFAQ